MASTIDMNIRTRTFARKEGSRVHLVSAEHSRMTLGGRARKSNQETGSMLSASVTCEKSTAKIRSSSTIFLTIVPVPQWVAMVWKT